MSSKTAEIGQVPDHWEVAELIRFLDRITYGFTNPMPDADEGPWKVTAKDVVNGYINYDTARKTTAVAFTEKLTDKSRPNIGDVLLTKDGSIGRVAVVDRDDVCINQSVALLQPNSKIDSYFLKYLLIAPHYQKVMIGDADGSTIQHIYITRVDKMEVAVPPLDEQISIVNVVKTIDDKIRINEALNQTLEQIAQAIFKSWFIDFEPVKAKQQIRALGGNDEQSERAAQAVIAGAVNLDAITSATDLGTLNQQLTQALRKKLAHQTDPQREQHANTASHFPDQLVESELGLIPEAWQPTFIKDVAKIIKGNSYKSSELAESTTALVTLKSFNRGGGYRLDGLKEYTGAYKPEQRVFAGDLIIAYTDVTQAADVIGKPAMVIGDPRYEHLVISLDVAVIRPVIENLNWFLYGLARTYVFQQHTRSYTTGTTVLHLGKEAVPGYRFPMPTSELVDRYAELSSPMFRSINERVEDGRVLELVRDALLPKLLSGELQPGKAA